jgi:hypothetical protein
MMKNLYVSRSNNFIALSQKIIMKKNILLFFFLSYVSICSSQIPQAFSFQALVLDGSGDPVGDQSVGVQIDILDGTINGTVIYSETHRPMSNSNGLYTIEIGNGSNPSSRFEDIDWLSGDKFVSLSHDITGGTNYTAVGSSQLLSVPYALAAGTAFIEPMIYASIERSGVTTFDNTRPDTEKFITFNYQWIQGIPETVFIEYSNVPDNLHLENTFFGQRSENVSQVDTIVDGIVRPLTRLVHTNQSIPLIVGSYIMDMVFRTDTEVLATIEYPIEIIDPAVEVRDCTAEFVGIRTITMDCDSLTNFIGTTAEFIAQNETRMTINNFLNLGENVDLEFFDEIECNDIRLLNDTEFESGNLIFRDFEIRRDFEALEITFEVFDVNGSFENFGCEIRYE